MTHEQKIEFINDLIHDVKSDIIDKVGRMPEEWNGIELRFYIAEKFMDQTGKLTYRDKRKYLQDVVNNNL